MRLLAALILGLGFAFPAAFAGLAEADALFTQGEFEKADAAYAAAADGGPKALRRRGQIRLFANDWDGAETLLRQALAADPKDSAAAAAMGELESRRGRFQLASVWFKRAGRMGPASGHALFGADTPYQVTRTPRGAAAIPFVQTDPLPVVMATVNGREGLFILDTGAHEVALDPNFAKAAGVQTAQTGGQAVFAGGRTAEVKAGKIARFAFGPLEIANVPATLVPTTAFSAVTGGKPVAGVIGTGLFSRFRTTIDYPKGRLILSAPAGNSAEARAPTASIRFWHIGTHYLLAQGQLRDAPATMFFIDSGLAGFAFTAPESSLRAAGIPVPTPTGDKGGIGQSAAAEFKIDALRLGSFRRTDLSGLYGPFPPPIENGLGVRVGGLISHQFFRPYAVTFDFKRMVVELR